MSQNTQQQDREWIMPIDGAKTSSSNYDPLDSFTALIGIPKKVFRTLHRCISQQYWFIYQEQGKAEEALSYHEKALPHSLENLQLRGT